MCVCAQAHSGVFVPHCTYRGVLLAFHLVLDSLLLVVAEYTSLVDL